MRRLPIYMLIDTSGSMADEPIQAVQIGLKMFQTALRNSPEALERAFVSVITFDSEARQATPLTGAGSFVPPPLTASGDTSMGAALKLVTECAEREVVKNTYEKKGDWRPLVFILTDGKPTDNVAAYIKPFRERSWGMKVACAAGPYADTMILQEIAGENVLTLSSTSPSDIEKYFVFLSSLAVTASDRAKAGEEIVGIGDLGQLPPEISLLKV
jgi:uncharacterized protein YegL